MRLPCLFFILLFCSCSKYLDKKNDATLTVPTTVTDLQALLDDATTMNLQRTPSLFDALADAHFATPAAMAAMDDYNKEAYSWNIPDYESIDWSAGYTPVYVSNYCLERIDETPMTADNQAAWENVKGSAHFFRGYYYLYLLWQYGKGYDAATATSDYGIVLRETTDFNVPSIRSSVAAGYAQVLSDMHSSLALLPRVPVNIFRPGKAAAYATLARTHLSMRNYDSAYYYADLCLGIKSDLLDYNSISVDARIPFVRYENPEFIFYTEQYAGAFNTHRASDSFVDTLLVASFGTGDLRQRAFLQASQGYHTYKGGYSANRNRLFSGIATDELFLMRAECHARAGRVTEAMNDLNHLLRHRWDGTFAPLTASTPSEALALVLNERKKELLFRSVRWMDLKRLNLEGAGIVLRRIVDGQVVELQPNDPRYAIKLPSDIVEITGMPQN
jgi:hypothetical protein